MDYLKKEKKMKIRSLIYIAIVVIVGSYLNSANAVTYQSRRPLGEHHKIVAVRQQLKRAVEALKTDPDYLTLVDVAQLDQLIKAVAYYLNIVDVADLTRLQAVAQRRINSGDLSGYKNLLQQIDEQLELEPEVEIYIGDTIDAR